MEQGREATERRILRAAQRLFSERAYDQVTMRMIAAEASANVALINRYFGSKRELFASILAEQGRFPGVLDEGPDLAHALAEYVADRLSSGSDSLLVSTIARSSSSGEIHDVVVDRVQSAILGPLLERLDGREAELKAALVTAIISGAAQFRHLFGPIGALPREAVVARLTAIFQAALN
ncbi:TetR family transcriptional regulator [Nonomuraea sp. NBC_01738]|uniref:TetR/AcrR family transcriptional regulator n=1 Tax=Nonomuraea sp. NBC_01738 TaxID=2976003 RepID=UPI002E146FF6|nr:TetR family transcriptional regulator [Nonomuraea sp. NBC_01738]